MLHIEVTGRCHLRCRYCYNSAYNTFPHIQNELSTEEICSLIEEAKHLGYQEFSISGGEPFLKEGITVILDACANSCVTIFTSASLPERSWIQTVVNSPQIRTLRVSLDGLFTNDKVRVGSHWSSVLSNLQKIKAARQINLEINSMITAVNINELVPLYCALKLIKPDRWNLDIPTFTGKAQDPKSKGLFNLSFQDLISAFGHLLQIYLIERPFRLSIRYVYDSFISTESLGQFFHGKGLSGILFPPNVHPCIFERITAIRPSGDITRCPSHNEILSNVRVSGSLEKAIDISEQHEFMTYRLSDLSECMECRYVSFCGGGCRANARYLRGADLYPDPIACTLVSLAERHIWHLLPTTERNIYQQFTKKDGRRPVVRRNLLDCIG